jgi:hypothetical protein
MYKEEAFQIVTDLLKEHYDPLQVDQIIYALEYGTSHTKPIEKFPIWRHVCRSGEERSNWMDSCLRCGAKPL